MPRDSGGTYTLPAGNPVVDGTVIESVWANTTLNDVALQLNNVLTRDGVLGPNTPVLFVDGTVALPGIAFAVQPGTGMYRLPPSTLGVSVAGVSRQTWAPALTTIVGDATIGGNAVIGGTAAITGNVTLTAGIVATNFNSSSVEPITLTNANASIVWRVGGSEEPPGMYIGRSGAATMTVKAAGGVVFTHATRSIEFLENGFCPATASTLNLGTDLKPWLDLFVSSNAWVYSPSSGAAQGFRIQTGGGTSLIGHDNNAGTGIMTPNPGVTALCLATANARNIAFGTNNELRVVISALSPEVQIGHANAVGPTLILLGNTGGRPNLRFNNGAQTWNTALKSDIGQNWYMISNPSESVGVYMTPSAPGWNNISDARYKTAWTELTHALDRVMTLHAGTFKSTLDLKLPRDVGLLAQDVYDVLPEAVSTDDPKRLGLRYTHIVPLLVKAIQELAVITAGKRLPGPARTA